jgi:metal-responsive CopG/Arc/MetJ family transcriptional regulator
MRNVEVDLPEEVVDALDERAEERGETRSQVAAEMVDEWLSRRSA